MASVTRVALLLAIGFIGGLTVSFMRYSVAPWGSASMFARPARSYSDVLPARGGGSSGGAAAAGGRAVAAVIKPASQPAAPNAAPARAAGPSAAEIEARLPVVCNNTARMPDITPEWHIIKPSEIDPVEYKCHWTNLTHWALAHHHKLPPIQMCTHDPTVDTVISSHLHQYGFWGAPDEFMIVMAIGPCTAERPYMLDIGANIGLFTLISAEKGCRVVSFEPLNDNAHRLAQSLQRNGYWDRVMLFQHAVGKFFTEVTIGFRPHNPGSSGINLGGSKSETRDQITIDGLLLGPKPPVFGPAAGANLPAITGDKVNFVKIDTEGYDVAVVGGMLRTLLDGGVPHILIEFSPGDAAGTAGCDPFMFVRTMYEHGYSMYEYGKPQELKHLLDEGIPAALRGEGRRVFEAWFIKNDAAPRIMKDGKLRTED